MSRLLYKITFPTSVVGGLFDTTLALHARDFYTLDPNYLTAEDVQMIISNGQFPVWDRDQIICYLEENRRPGRGMHVLPRGHTVDKASHNNMLLKQEGIYEFQLMAGITPLHALQFIEERLIPSKYNYTKTDNPDVRYITFISKDSWSDRIHERLDEIREYRPTSAPFDLTGVDGGYIVNMLDPPAFKFQRPRNTSRWHEMISMYKSVIMRAYAAGMPTIYLVDIYTAMCYYTYGFSRRLDYSTLYMSEYTDIPYNDFESLEEWFGPLNTRTPPKDPQGQFLPYFRVDIITSAEGAEFVITNHVAPKVCMCYQPHAMYTSVDCVEESMEELEEYTCALKNETDALTI